jgi:hypothetical protein
MWDIPRCNLLKQKVKDITKRQHLDICVLSHSAPISVDRNLATKSIEFEGSDVHFLSRDLGAASPFIGASEQALTCVSKQKRD